MANRSRAVMSFLLGGTLFACGGAPATTRQSQADHAQVCTRDCGGPAEVRESPAPPVSIEVAPEGEHLRDHDESDTLTCAARAAGNVDCWGPEASRWPRESPPARSIATPSPVDHLFVDGDSLCVITIDRAMHCASGVVSDDPTPTWELMAQDVLDSDHGEGWWCVIAGPARHVYCGGQLRIALPARVLPLDPRRAQAIDGTAVSAQSLAMGERHVCVILADGRIACMGDGSGGQLGLGADELLATSLRVIPGMQEARTVVATRSRSCALDAVGTVRCWGDSIFFDAQEQPVARLVFCLSCNTMETFPTAPLQAMIGTILPRGLNLNALCRSTGIGGCLDE